MLEGFAKHMITKEAIYSTGIEKGWTEKECQIRFIMALVQDTGVSLSFKEASELLEEMNHNNKE